MGSQPHQTAHPSASGSNGISGGTLRIRLATGETVDVLEKSGETHWSVAAPLHDTQNTGNTPIRILLIEVKPR